MKIFLTTFLLIFAAKSSFTAKVSPHYEDVDKALVIYTYNKDETLSCNVTEVTTKPTVEWQKDGKLVSTVDGLSGRVSYPEAKQIEGGWIFHMKIRDAQYSDAGTISCVARDAGAEIGRGDINFAAKVAVRIKTSNINVVEEEKLRIECQAKGNPRIVWFLNTTRNEQVTLEDAGDGRSSNITIEDFNDEDGIKIENGVLIIPVVVKEDRGNYTCMGFNRLSEKEESSSSSYVRVKDKYAALWPFLGICAEVVVLCAVIIIYEKKRNKTELEESDTDQSPDQNGHSKTVKRG